MTDKTASASLGRKFPSTIPVSLAASPTPRDLHPPVLPHTHTRKTPTYHSQGVSPQGVVLSSSCRVLPPRPKDARNDYAMDVVRVLAARVIVAGTATEI